MGNKKINVTESYLPEKEDFFELINEIWESKTLTNRGLMVQKLENNISNFLELSSEYEIIAMCNGTIPLQIMLKLLGKKGEIITTPFSYIATTSSILWENCTPIFADINSETLCIDEKKIESLITNKTTCILATHVFGNPCAIEELQRIADKHCIKLLYDGAHSFGVKYRGKSIMEYGDITSCSFHATKIFHTAEGGAVFAKKEYIQNIFRMHNFGHNGPSEFDTVGINGKMNELSAALGLLNLKSFWNIVEKRKFICQFYDREIDWSYIVKPLKRKYTEPNYSYYPIIFDSEKHMNRALSELNKKNIFPRKYFYPSLNLLNFLEKKYDCPISEKIASTILCLPLSTYLNQSDLKKIVKVINNL